MTAPVRLRTANGADNHGSPRFIARTESLLSALVLAAVAIVAIFGWINRESIPWRPDEGWGYALGIIGASMMLLLVIYPLRKRFTSLRWIGSVGLWFRLHMLLGLIGPLAILYHSRFRFSATNSGVALYSMMIVVVAGLVGWLFYRHVYRGYELRRLEARELLEEMVASRAALEADGDAGEDVRRELEALEQEAARNGRGVIGSFAALAKLSVRTRAMSFALKRRIRRHFAENVAVTHWLPSELRRHQREATHHLSIFLRAVREAAGFALYDRLVRLWHYLHLPLFYFMAVAVVVHIVAVHMY